jgi:hypothetical protein
LPVQKASPQAQVVAGSVSRKIDGGTGEEGGAKSAAAAQEPGTAGVLGPAGSAAKPGRARHVPTSRRTRAARRTGVRCFMVGSPFLITVLRERKGGTSAGLPPELYSDVRATGIVAGRLAAYERCHDETG